MRSSYIETDLWEIRALYWFSVHPDGDFHSVVGILCIRHISIQTTDIARLFIYLCLPGFFCRIVFPFYWCFPFYFWIESFNFISCMFYCYCLIERLLMISQVPGDLFWKCNQSPWLNFKITRYLENRAENSRCWSYISKSFWISCLVCEDEKSLSYCRPLLKWCKDGGQSLKDVLKRQCYKSCGYC